MTQIRVQTRKSGIERNIAAVAPDPRQLVQLCARRRNDHIEQMQFVVIDRLIAAAGEFARRLRPEPFGVNPEWILRLKPRPLSAGIPVTVPERMRLHPRRREMGEKLRHMPVKRLCKERKTTESLNRKEERQKPLRVARGVKHPLGPTPVPSAIVRKNRTVNIKRIRKIPLTLRLRNHTMQDKRELSEVGRQPPGVGKPRIPREIPVHQKLIHLPGILPERRRNPVPLLR